MKRRNVTIVLDEETARWARVEAARNDVSVSKLIARLLREHMLTDQSYEEAMSAYLTAPARRLKKRGARYPNREDLHDRAGLR